MLLRLLLSVDWQVAVVVGADGQPVELVVELLGVLDVVLVVGHAVVLAAEHDAVLGSEHGKLAHDVGYDGFAGEK